MKKLLLVLLLFPSVALADFTCVRNDAAATALASADGDAMPTGCDAFGRAFTSSQITSIAPGTGATSLGKAEDAAHSTGDVGVGQLSVREAAPTTSFTATTDGDYAFPKVDGIGATYVTPGTQAATFEGASVAFGSITGSYVALLANASAHRWRWCAFNNATNTAVSWDDGTNAIMEGQPANTVFFFDGGQLGRDIRTGIRIKYVTAPASGTAYVSCMY